MSDKFEFRGKKYDRRPIHEQTAWLIPEKRYYIPENENIEEVLWAIENGKHALLEGEPGTGKSEMVLWLCAELNIPLIQIQGDGEQSVADLVGANTYNEERGGMVFDYGKIPFAFMNGCSILFDEMNGVLPEVLMKMHSAMDDRRILDLKENIVEKEVNGKLTRVPEVIPVPEESIIFGTQNPFDTGRHIGTKPLSPALLSRFNIKVNVDYLSKSEEVKLLQKRTGISKADAQGIVNVAIESRKGFCEGEVTMPIDHRMTIAWAELAQAGFGVKRAATTTMLNFLDENDIDVMRGVLIAIGIDKAKGKGK